MFFHTAGYSFPYRNMHYVVVAGGNAFYQKRSGQDRDTPNSAADVPIDPLTQAPGSCRRTPAPEAVAQSRRRQRRLPSRIDTLSGSPARWGLKRWLTGCDRASQPEAV